MREEELKKIFSKVIDDFVENDFSFEEYGDERLSNYLDSLDLVQFQMDIENSLKIQLPNKLFTDSYKLTINEFYKELRSELNIESGCNSLQELFNYANELIWGLSTWFSREGSNVEIPEEVKIPYLLLNDYIDELIANGEVKEK